MKVIDLNKDVIGTENEVDGGTWISRRILFKKDGMGFSMNDTRTILKQSIASKGTAKSKR